MQEIRINIPEQDYAVARQRAKQEGFESVEIFLTDLVLSGIRDEDENIDHLFTAERLAKIDAADADVRAGNSYTAEQVRGYFADKHKNWPEKP